MGNIPQLSSAPTHPPFRVTAPVFQQIRSTTTTANPTKSNPSLSVSDIIVSLITSRFLWQRSAAKHIALYDTQPHPSISFSRHHHPTETAQNDLMAQLRYPQQITLSSGARSRLHHFRLLVTLIPVIIVHDSRFSRIL